MARPEAVAVGLYYRTPDHLLPDTFGLLRVPVAEPKEARVAVCDPCAGEGAAVAELAAWVAGAAPGVEVGAYACELEASRYAALQRAVGYKHRGGLAHGDAFCLRAPPTPGAGVLFLNPPYHDKEPGTEARLEVRFVRRTLPLLAVGGVLLLVVPHYSLADMVDPLARELEDARCFRFPAGDFSAFKQVLLVGRRRHALSVDDPGLAACLRSWSTSPEACEPWEALASAAGTYAVPTLPRHQRPFEAWEVASLDLAALAAQTGPWRKTSRAGRAEPLAAVYPPSSGLALLRRRYPVVSPLKPAYVAAAVACGIFDGEAVRPDDPETGLPEVLVRGVFARDFVAVDEKVDDEGEVVGEVQVQQPKLEVTVLDLSSGKYVRLASSAERTGAAALDGMTVADLLAAYARSLLAVMAANCPVLHDPARDEAFPLPALERAPFPAQAHAVRAAVKLIAREHAPDRRAWCGEDRPPCVPLNLAEVGAGKTLCALTTAAAVGARDLLVLCPPHLVDRSWPDEVRKTLGARAETLTLDSPDAIAQYAARAASVDRPEYLVGVLSREAAKLSYAREPVRGACPRCGAALPDGDLAGKRARCKARTRAPAVDPDTGLVDQAARLAVALAAALSCARPDSPAVAQYLPWRARPLRVGDPEAAERAARERLPALCYRALSLAQADPRPAVHLALALGGESALADALEAALEARRLDATGWETAQFLRYVALLVPEERRADVVGAMQLREHDRPPDFAAADAARAGGGEYGSLSFAGGTVALEKREVGSLRHALRALDLLGAAALWDEAPECGEPLWQASPRLGRRVALADWILRKHPRLFEFFILDESHEHSDRDACQTIASTKLMRRVGRGVALSGSACSGYAASLFAGTYARDPRFRESFARDDETEFVRRYGYVKRVVEDRDKETGKVVAFGATSDRVIRSHRVTGHAPGVLPLFLLDHLLRTAVPLHKADLALDLPPHREEHVRVELDGVLAERFEELVDAVVDEIKRSRYKKGKAGKLWGALGELVAFPDVCTEDVTPGGAYEVRYPPEVEEGERRPTTRKQRRDLPLGELVWSVPTLPASTVLPKERALLRRLREGRARGDRTLIFVRHVELMPRIARLISEEFGEECPVLYASKPEGLTEPHARGRVGGSRGGGAGARDVVGGRGAGVDRRDRERADEHGGTCNDVGGDQGASARIVVCVGEEEGLGGAHEGAEDDQGRRRRGGGAADASVSRAGLAGGAGGRRRCGPRVVGAHERQAWIEREVVARGAHELVVNPVAVKTGLNVLTYFNVAWWHENPGCDAVTCRQANGRIDRIGKTRETTSVYATAGALQEKAHVLWMHKVAASLAADGLDPGAAMALAGLGESDGLDAMGVARQLFELVERCRGSVG